ncbi:hypothetical protein Q5530_15685 [Saccharothrix sp. BKS2]|uniref:hypothetical protein n=1 Tax=Saccharothrix sp. BKS2 TaxID=3064400 RepID=UPI0039EBBE56
MEVSKEYVMSREEIDALREGATPFWYGGDRQTIVSFSAWPDGIRLTLTCFATPDEPQMSTVIPWGEFDKIAADMPKMVASGVASRAANRSIHVGHPGVQRG